MPEIQKVNWLDLTDSQKAQLLEQIRAHLNQQMEEAKISKSIMADLDKHSLI